jgi:hypothetical protein
MEVKHRFDVEVTLHRAHLKVNPLLKTALIELHALAQYLVGQQGGSSVKEGHLHVTVGEGFQGHHQIELAFDLFPRTLTCVEEHSKIDIAVLRCLPTSERSEKINDHNVRTSLQIRNDLLTIKIRQLIFHSEIHCSALDA